jgi:hypothetical protein
VSSSKIETLLTQETDMKSSSKINSKRNEKKTERVNANSRLAVRKLTLGS